MTDTDTDATHRFLIADDHPLFRGALRAAISGRFASAHIAEAGNFEEVTADLEARPDTDLVLLDLKMPGVSGFSGLIYLRAQYPGVPVVVVSAHQDPSIIRRCMGFGASGFIPKTLEIDGMRTAIRTVLDGGVWVPPDLALVEEDNETSNIVRRLSTLTPQQVRVLMMLSDGLLNKQIAHELGVSEATVKAHVSAILLKLGVESRTQAVIAAAKIAAGQGPELPDHQ
jgi:DNA-binding NarL/FixJ family response regulator